MIDEAVKERTKRGPDKERRPKYVPRAEAYDKQKSRLQVKVGSATRAKLHEELDKFGRGVAPYLIEQVAIRLSLIEAMALLESEVVPLHDHDAKITISPSDELLGRAARLHISPHVLVRAASIKIATEGYRAEDNDPDIMGMP